MSSFASLLARTGLGLVLAFATATGAVAGIVDLHIDDARGVDSRVAYGKLTAYGPWDDRNYELTAEDLALLSPNETESRDPTPAFFRVWMRKEAVREGRPLPTRGPDQYPRSAVNTFLQKFGGLRIDGRIYRGINRVEGNRFEVFDEEELEEMNETWPRFVSGEVRITTPQGAEETAVAVNPVDTNYVIAGSNGPGSGQKMWRSTDGGATWSGAISLSGNTCCDASVGWSTDGTIAYTSTLINCGSSCGVAFYRSTDQGQTWVQSPLLVSSGSDKEYLHVDSYAGSPYKDNIYVSWHQSNVQKFARSTDKGLTFSTPQTLDSAFKGIGSDITTDKQGNVYYFFPSTGGRQVRVVKSTDGGISFAASGAKVADTKASFDFPLPSMSTRNAFIYVAADADFTDGPYGNSLYVAWSDTYATDNDSSATANHARVQVAYSRDGGVTWTVTTPHPTDDGQTVDRYQQWLKVDDWGRVHVVYYDTRHSNNRAGVDVYYSVSLDGGQTWEEPRRLTTATSPKINTSMEWGDYNGMDMAMNDVIAIYTDNRAGIDVWGIGGFADSPGPDYRVAIPNQTQQACAGGPITPVQVTVSSLAGYTGSVTLELPSLDGAAFTGGLFTPGMVSVPANSEATATLTLGTQPDAAHGTYPVLVRGTDTQAPPVVQEATFNVQIASGTTVTPALTAPANGAGDVPRTPTLVWAVDPAAASYTVEIATDEAFADVVASGSPADATWTPPTPLQPMTTYYWRVRANSPCGDSGDSQVFAFTTGVTFPEPYCAVTFPNAVEPITRVKVSGIDNTSPAGVNGSPAHEDFLGVAGGSVAPGQTYSMAVEGNTDGNYTTKVNAFVDWNRNGSFDAGESYTIGDIVDSTGTDGKQAVADVAVPAAATPGPVRLRVIKKYSTAATACNDSGYGQAEDYTLTVGGGTQTYTVGGDVSGLSGGGLVLRLNGGSDLAVDADGAFAFPGGLDSGAAYEVTIGTQPSGQTCAVVNGTGTIASADVTDVEVGCADDIDDGIFDDGFEELLR